MAFPNVVSTATTPSATATTLAITMPSGISVGNLLVAIVAADNDSAATMSGWTKPTNGWGSNGTNGNTVWLRKATGSDSGVHTNNSQNRFAHCYCIDTWSGILADVKVATGTTAVVNPPNLDMGTPADYLWIAAARNGNAPTAPTSYTNLVTVNFLGSAYLASARRLLNASSEDPGTFTVSSTTASAHALTIGIKGRSGDFLPFFA